MGLSPSPVAITGCGCFSAAGANCVTAMETVSGCLVHNSSVAAPYFPEPFSAPCFVADNITDVSAFGCFGDCDPFYRYNRKMYMLLTVIAEAMAEAAMSWEELQTRRVGVAVGTTVGSTFHYEEYYKEWRDGREPDPQIMNHYLSANLAATVQDVLQVKGPKTVITNACASGTDAIGLAGLWLEQGLCDIAIAGGVDDLSRIACHGFKSLMLVAEESCTPFDAGRKGLNLGEGAGVMLLEKRDGLAGKPQGWLRGYGIAGDAHHPTAPHPEGRGLKLAIQKAMDTASVKLGDINLINAHGTGTKANDKAETTALAALGFEPGKHPVVSTKGVTGHTLGAAGALEAIFTLKSLNDGKVSGTAGCQEVDSSFSFQPLTQQEHWVLDGRVGMSQSLAFGGNNSALILEGSGI